MIYRSQGSTEVAVQGLNAKVVWIIYFRCPKQTIRVEIVIKKFIWHQNILLFTWYKFAFNKTYFHYMTFFHVIKIYMYSIKINLCSTRNIFIVCIFFCSSNIFFYYTNFLFNTFLVSISGLPFAFTEVRIFLSVCKLNSNTRV